MDEWLDEKVKVQCAMDDALISSWLDERVLEMIGARPSESQEYSDGVIA